MCWVWWKTAASTGEVEAKRSESLSYLSIMLEPNLPELLSRLLFVLIITEKKLYIPFVNKINKYSKEGCLSSFCAYFSILKGRTAYLFDLTL